MVSTGQAVAAVILGLIGFACLAWIFYHLETFTSNVFGNLLISVAGIICLIVACAEGGIIGGNSGSE